MIATPAKGETVSLHVTPKDKQRVQIGISWDTGKEMVKKGVIFKTEEMVNVSLKAYQRQFCEPESDPRF